jgi:Amt family ammonium transporter
MWFVQGRPDVGITLNGSLGGAVGVTACCANISPASAFIVGLIAGIITTVATIALERLKIDDAVGAVPVHLCNGWWGTLSVALFNMDGFDAHKLGVQALGTISVTLTSFVICFGIFKVVDMTVGLRATDNEQIDGLDFSEHAANAYPDFQTTEQA